MAAAAGSPDVDKHLGTRSSPLYPQGTIGSRPLQLKKPPFPPIPISLALPIERYPNPIAHAGRSGFHSILAAPGTISSKLPQRRLACMIAQAGEHYYSLVVPVYPSSYMAPKDTVRWLQMLMRHCLNHVNTKLKIFVNRLHGVLNIVKK